MGYFYSIACAFFWAISLIMFKSIINLPAVRVNVVKNILSLSLVFPTFWFFEGRLLPEAPMPSLWVLILSGIIGVGIADALVLVALRRLPAGLVSLLECCYSPMVLILSTIFLKEHPSVMQLVGGGLIVFSSAIASSHGWNHIPMRQLVTGTLIMVSAIFLMAIGIVMVKPIYDTVGFWDIVVIRMMAGLVGSLGVFAFFREEQTLRKLLIGKRIKIYFLVACFFASYLGFVLWLAGYKFLDASLSSALNQTSTIFTLFFAAIVLKERLTKLGYIAVSLAVVGVLLLSKLA